MNMKLLTVSLAIAFVTSSYAEPTCDYRAAMYGFQEMRNLTNLAWASGCCPVIVSPSPTGSVIEGYSGYRGNAAVIVDYGTCTAQPDGGLLWYVSWGDGSFDYQRTTTLGPFQVAHQYARTPATYSVPLVTFGKGTYSKRLLILAVRKSLPYVNKWGSGRLTRDFRSGSTEKHFKIKDLLLTLHGVIMGERNGLAENQLDIEEFTLGTHRIRDPVPKSPKNWRSPAPKLRRIGDPRP
eukprot:Em0014g199a